MNAPIAGDPWDDSYVDFDFIGIDDLMSANNIAMKPTAKEVAEALDALIVQRDSDYSRASEAHEKALREAEVKRAAALPMMRAANPNGAACSTHDHPEWFWDPKDKSEFVKASAVCKHLCPRAAECLSEAMKNGQEWGVHGGIWFVDGKPTRRFHVSNVA